MASATFPYATVAVNLSGCFLLGILAQVASVGGVNAEARILIAMGLLGGFTTYSGFNQETLSMLASGAYAAAAGNVAVTLAGGLALGALGMSAARALGW